jgi:AraC family transcriptional regulator
MLDISGCRRPGGVAIRLDRLLADEQVWREVPDPERGGDAGHQVVIGHWTDARTEERELVAPVFDGHYTVSILLGTATVDCYKDGRLRGKGTGGIGGIQLTAPGERVLCGFRGPNEAIHLFFPQAVVESEYESVRRRDVPLRLDDPAFRVDPALGPLARSLTRSLARPPDMGTGSGALYGDSLAYAILAHVLSRYAREASDSSCGGLPSPRLHRVMDYIDANLGEPITLQDIAQQAGLSRMHFAAQFRLATGSTPHAFLLSRRIERARALLMEGMPIVQVALAVGFQAQAHFTTAFRNLSGVTPARWRARQRTATGMPAPRTRGR